MFETLQADDFRPHLNTSFAVYFEADSSQEIELIQIENVTGDTPEETQREPFSLVFRSKDREAYIQQTYRITHDVMGELSFFLVPLGPDKEGMRYEAVFS